jgi:hypothetical protein
LNKERIGKGNRRIGMNKKYNEEDGSEEKIERL